MLYGDNGILNKAKYASEEYKNATEDEKEQLAKMDSEIQSSRETVTISKEEYDKLKNANTYSEEEIVVGTWIDGKPIYRKVIMGTTPTVNGEMASIPDKGVTVFLDGYVIDNTGGYERLGGGFSNFGNCINSNTNSSSIAFYGAQTVLNRPFMLIIEYTKTTD